MVGEAPLAVIAPALDEDTATVTKVFALSSWSYYGADFHFESIAIDCPGGWLDEDGNTAKIAADGLYRQSVGKVIMRVGADANCASNSIKCLFNGILNGTNVGEGCSIDIPTVDVDGKRYLLAGDYEAVSTAKSSTSFGIVEGGAQSIVPKHESMMSSTSSHQLTGTLTDKGIKLIFTYSIKRIH